MSKLQKNFQQRIDLLDKRDKGLDEGYYFNQNDIGTATILAEITTGNKPVDLTDASVSLSVLTPDGEKAVSICPIINSARGIAQLLFTRDMLTTPGLASFQVTIQKGLQVVVSNTFYFSINDSIMQDGDMGNLGDIETLPLLIKLQAHASNVINNESKILNRVEKLEVKVINSESERDYAEEFRIENENNRILAEEERQKRHLERIGIDKKIDTTFNALTKNIDAIYKDEQERVDNEKLRVERYETITNGFKEIYASEKERQDNEQYRIDTFSNVTSGEDERMKNEKLRVANENERVKSEKLRASRENSRLELDTKIQAHFSKADSLITNFEKTVKQHEQDMKNTKDTIINTNKTVLDGEKKRVQAENQRMSDENNRKKEEQVRIENEKLREQMYLKAKDDLEKLNAVADETKLHEYVDSKLGNKADANHTHKLENIIGVDEKIKTFTSSIDKLKVDIGNVNSSLSSKANKIHKHNITDIENLTTKLNEKLDIKDMNVIVGNLQPSGNYVEHTEFEQKLEQKASKNDVSTTETALRNQITETEKGLKSLIDAKSPKKHVHNITDINGLDTTLDNKFNKSGIKDYVTITEFNTTLDRRLERIADNEKIQSIVEELGSKATKAELFGSEKNLKSWVGTTLNSYQPKGNYATKTELTNSVDDILAKIVKNEKIEEIDKSLTTANERISSLSSKISVEYGKLDKSKADKLHVHSFSTLTNVPTDLIKRPELANYTKKGEILEKDIKGCTRGVVSDVIISDSGEVKTYVVKNGKETLTTATVKLATANSVNSLSSTLNTEINKKANKTDLNNKADKTTVQSLEGRLSGKADASRVATIESEIGKIDDFFVDTINMIHREIGN